MSAKKTVGKRVDKAVVKVSKKVKKAKVSAKKTTGKHVDKVMGKSKKETIGERIDKVVDEVSEKVEKAKGKIATAKEEVADFAQDISKSVKKAVDDSGDAVADLIHTKK